MRAFGAFDLKDYRFIAMMPDSDNDDQAWVIIVVRGGLQVRRDVLPMIYAPRFGPDVGDVAALADRVEVIIRELGLEGQ